MQPRKNLRDAATGGIAPNHDISKPKLLSQTFDVLDVIFNQICGFRIPIGIAVTAHVNRHHVIARREMRSDVIERVRDTADSVQHDQRLLVG